MQCKVCGGPADEVAFDDRGFQVKVCSKCRFGQVYPMPSAEEVARLYDSPEYFSTHMHYDYDRISQGEIDRQVKTAGQLHSGIVGPFLANVKSVLEIGPGGGFALKYFQLRGMAARGLETSKSGSDFMRQRLGLSVDNAMLEEYETREQYDLVMLNHVLEHFLDVHEAMRRLKSLVKQNGLLYVRVPDHDSYDRRAMGKAWPAYLPFHISYFSEASLRLLFEQYGFKVLKTSSFISERFLRGWPGPIRQLGIRAVGLLGLQKQFKGRTIAIVGRLGN